MEAVRLEHIGHETSVKSIGALYVLFGGLALLSAFSALLELLTYHSGSGDLASLFFMLLIAMGMLPLGASVRSLKPRARIIMAVVSGLLAAFPPRSRRGPGFLPVRQLVAFQRVVTASFHEDGRRRRPPGTAVRDEAAGDEAAAHISAAGPRHHCREWCSRTD